MCPKRRNASRKSGACHCAGWIADWADPVSIRGWGGVGCGATGSAIDAGRAVGWCPRRSSPTSSSLPCRRLHHSLLLLLLLLSRRCLFSLSTRKNERGTDREKSQTINLSSGWNKWVALFCHAFILHPKRNLLFTFIFINTNIFADSYYYQNLGRLLNPGIGIYNRSISSISSTCIFCQNSSQNPIWCDWRTP